MFAPIRFALGLLAAAAVPHAPATADEPVKVVYHVSEGNAQASRALVNIRNHLAADPAAKIVVVTHGPGIDFVLDGAADERGAPFGGPVAALANQGVDFRVCANTLENRGIAKDRVVMEAQVVPSGVAEIARLQARQGFVYLRP